MKTWLPWEIPARQAFGVSATDTDIFLLCPNAVEVLWL